MTKIFLLFMVVGIAGAVIAGTWQHLRYLRVRRERVEDRQAPGRVNDIVLAWMQGEPVPGNTRPGGSDGATE